MKFTCNKRNIYISLFVSIIIIMVLVLKLELHALSLRELTKVNQNQNNKQAEMIDLSKKNEKTLSEIDKRLSLFSDLVKKNEKKLSENEDLVFFHLHFPFLDSPELMKLVIKPDASDPAYIAHLVGVLDYTAVQCVSSSEVSSSNIETVSVTRDVTSLNTLLAQVLGNLDAIKQKFSTTTIGHETNAYFFRNLAKPGSYYDTGWDSICGQQVPIKQTADMLHNMIEKEIGVELRSRKNKKFMELAVGPIATNLIRICRKYNPTTCSGIDRSTLSVGVNRLLEPKMEFRVSDINGDMAFPPLTYDLMFQQFSILWNMQRKSLLEQIHRALKIGGFFAHSGPCGCTTGCQKTVDSKELPGSSWCDSQADQHTLVDMCAILVGTGMYELVVGVYWRNNPSWSFPPSLQNVNATIVRHYTNDQLLPMRIGKSGEKCDFDWPVTVQCHCIVRKLEDNPDKFSIRVNKFTDRAESDT